MTSIYVSVSDKIHFDPWKLREERGIEVGSLTFYVDIQSATSAESLSEVEISADFCDSMDRHWTFDGLTNCSDGFLNRVRLPWTGEIHFSLTDLVESPQLLMEDSTLCLEFGINNVKCVKRFSIKHKGIFGSLYCTEIS